MIKRPSYNKILTLVITLVFTLVNLSVVSSVFCSMKDKTDCCCKHKTETKSCCSNKKEVKLVSHCVCEMKEANTEPAELLQNFTISHTEKTLKIFTPAEILPLGNKSFKSFSNSIINTFHSPPNEDINIIKCVLRI